MGMFKNGTTRAHIVTTLLCLRVKDFEALVHEFEESDEPVIAQYSECYVWHNVLRLSVPRNR